jgi:N,N'-diacetyllegionaminate synthase
MMSKNNVNLIAEIGGNHEGNFDYALELTELAIKSSADCVKFQLYTGETIVNKLVDLDRQKHFSKFELTKEQHIDLAKSCIKNGKEYLASVWDKSMLDWIDPFLERYKVGSGDLTNKVLLQEFARRGKPIIVSTGLSFLTEVLDAIEFIRAVNPIYSRDGYLTVMQCTSMYPIGDEDANLSVLGSFADIDNITLGYSDHTEDSEALYLAVAMGAKVLEFHFTDSRDGKAFRDHKVSLTRFEVDSLRQRINRAELLMGSSEKIPLKIEKDNGHVSSFRRALYLNRDISAGDIVTEEFCVALRPNVGISAWDLDKLVGLRAKKGIAKLEPLSFSMFH